MPQVGYAAGPQGTAGWYPRNMLRPPALLSVLAVTSGCGGHATTATSTAPEPIDAGEARAQSDSGARPDAGPSGHVTWLAALPDDPVDVLRSMAAPPIGSPSAVTVFTYDHRLGVLDPAGGLVSWVETEAESFVYAVAPYLDGGFVVTGSIPADSTFCGEPSTTQACTCGADNAYPCPCPDAYAARIDASGHLVWCARHGGDDAQEATAAAVDDAGNVYVAGMTGIVLGMFDHSHPPTCADLFLVAYSPTGDLKLEETFPDPAGAADVLAMGFDPTGALILVTTANGTVDYGLGLMGEEDHGGIWRLRMDPTGTPLSVDRLAESAYISSECRASVDSDGRVAVVGHGKGMLTAGPFNVQSDELNYVALGADADGTVRWLHPISFDPGEWPELDIARVDAGDTLLGAAHRTVLAFEGQESVAPSGGQALFLASIREDGGVSWTEQWTTDSTSTGGHVVVHAAGAWAYFGSTSTGDIAIPDLGIVSLNPEATGFVAQVRP